jgi:hypothetical protein
MNSGPVEYIQLYNAMWPTFNTSGSQARAIIKRLPSIELDSEVLSLCAVIYCVHLFLVPRHRREGHHIGVVCSSKQACFVCEDWINVMTAKGFGSFKIGRWATSTFAVRLFGACSSLQFLIYNFKCLHKSETASQYSLAAHK